MADGGEADDQGWQGWSTVVKQRAGMTDVGEAEGGTAGGGENKSTSELSVRGEKINQLNRQLAPKNNPPHVHPPPSTNPPATLSDEELALLLHQELNSSPRVPRVPRMRHAGSLPQLASTTPTSTLMKRTLSSGGKDNGLVSRKKNKFSIKIIYSSP
ncbi:hypothetical protein L6452_41820 [Arctium lappa]|uniref:Uncharacterized protein n=1 Tax=Arctium lappa TaxID=4217 RepID=A0ACB8XHB1_ARCLA|nr:hypothetical protein L6452_41820 [Arctium lappa]